MARRKKWVIFLPGHTGIQIMFVFRAHEKRY